MFLVGLLWTKIIVWSYSIIEPLQHFVQLFFFQFLNISLLSFKNCSTAVNSIIASGETNEKSCDSEDQGQRRLYCMYTCCTNQVSFRLDYWVNILLPGQSFMAKRQDKALDRLQQIERKKNEMKCGIHYVLNVWVNKSLLNAHAVGGRGGARRLMS